MTQDDHKERCANERVDVRFEPLNVGDTVCIGTDNGSTLIVATVTKLTRKKVFMTEVGHEHEIPSIYNYCRDYNRVCKLT